jgi:hypothetical protein
VSAVLGSTAALKRYKYRKKKNGIGTKTKINPHCFCFPTPQSIKNKPIVATIARRAGFGGLTVGD